MIKIEEQVVSGMSDNRVLKNATETINTTPGSSLVSRALLYIP